LESSDPQRFEMIRKIQSLQKRVIARNQEIIEKGENFIPLHVRNLVLMIPRYACTAELLIQEKEKVYVELKNILARQPSPEVAEQV
jgi:hypothetical protein